MGRKDRKIREEGRSEFREFLYMNERLHEMLRFIGEGTSPTIQRRSRVQSSNSTSSRG
jgi:hypothetical protein